MYLDNLAAWWESAAACVLLTKVHVLAVLLTADELNLSF